MSDNYTRTANSGETPPDRGASGDVSTTGHSGRDLDDLATDTHQAGPTSGHASDHDAHTHGGHGDDDDSGHGHGGHGVDTSDVPTIVPTTWRQLIFPALILLLVAILVWGPINNAFQSRPAPLVIPQQGHSTNEEGVEGKEHSTEPTAAPGQPLLATPEIESVPVATGVVVTGVAVAATHTALVASAPPSSPTPSIRFAATKTAVAVAANEGVVSRAPVRLQFGGTSFVVKAGTGLLPDWQPPQDQGIATWIEGSVANHILYLPFSEQNATIFKAGKRGDKISLSMNTGQVFEFEVSRSERAFNGPPTSESQFTVTTAMAQDHAGVTLFLIGDSAPDRAVVQADFTGNIQ